MDGRARGAVAAFFSDAARLAVGAQVVLGEDAAHHVRVRRIGAGERIAVHDGAGLRAEGVLVRVAKSSATVDVDAVETLPSPPDVHLLVPVADRERMLWLAEKVVEIGVASWRPVLWARSRSVSPRGEGPTFAAKVRARMASALVQSGAGWLPVVHPEATVERAALAAPAGARLLLDPAGAPLLGLSHPDGAVTIATGPEGGVEDEERELLERAGFVRAALAGHILRFETAAIAALAIVGAGAAAKTGVPHG